MCSAHSSGEAPSSAAFGFAAGVVAGATTRAAASPLEVVAQARPHVVIPATRAHVDAFELVVQSVLNKVELSRFVIDLRDRERRPGAFPDGEEGAARDSPAHD